MNPGSATPKRARSLWLSVGLGIVGLGIVAIAVGIIMLVMVVRDVPRQIDRQPKVSVPGSATLQLQRGERGIWLETKAPSRPDIRNVNVVITSVADGQPLAVAFPTSVQNYDLQGRRGILIGTVSIPATSDYLIVVQGKGGDNVSFGATTVTDGLLDFSTAFIPLAIGIVFSGIGLIIVTITIIRRLLTRRTADAEEQRLHGSS